MSGRHHPSRRDAPLYNVLLEVSLFFLRFFLASHRYSSVFFLWCLPRMRSWMDLTLMILTFVFSMIWNVEVGIVVSIIISLLLVVRRSSKTRMAILVRLLSSFIKILMRNLCPFCSGRDGYLGQTSGSLSTRMKKLRKTCQAY